MTALSIMAEADDVKSHGVTASLPQAYKDVGWRAYFHEAVQFLEKYSWLYDFQLTKFIALKMWEKLPQEVGTCIRDCA